MCVFVEVIGLESTYTSKRVFSSTFAASSGHTRPFWFPMRSYPYHVIFVSYVPKTCALAVDNTIGNLSERPTLLGFVLAFVEYQDMIKDHNEFQFDLSHISSVLVGIEGHLDENSAILIGFELEH